jgi:GMP synthase-like glutamine amidotransferase
VAAASRQVLVLVHDADPDRGTREVGTIAPALRDLGSELLIGTLVGPSTLRTELPDPAGLQALIVMGSSAAAYADSNAWLGAEMDYLRRTIDAATPVLGVCFGGQLLARVLGGTVRQAERGEHGFVPVETTDPWLVPPGDWMEFHSDTFTVPPGADSVARTAAAEQAFVLGPHLGLQFHPEISPEVFDAWAESWEVSGDDDGVAELGIDVASIRADVARRRGEAADRCRVLVQRFLGRSAAT